MNKTNTKARRNQVSHLLPKVEGLPPIRRVHNDEDPVVHYRLFSPVGAAVWYVAAADKEVNRVSKYDDDFIMLVWADLAGDGVYGEWGHASLRELENVRLPYGLRIERDRAFKPCRFSATREGKAVSC